VRQGLILAVLVACGGSDKKEPVLANTSPAAEPDPPKPVMPVSCVRYVKKIELVQSCIGLSVELREM
jgi:hypothetical protein